MRPGRNRHNCFSTAEDLIPLGDQVRQELASVITGPNSRNAEELVWMAISI